MPRRKRTDSDLGVDPLPAQKRERALSMSATADATPAVDSAALGLDYESDVDIVAKKDDYIDEDGSFFFPPSYPPPGAGDPSSNHGCIQFVSVLPSELRKRKELENSARELGELESEDNSEPKVVRTRRATRSTTKSALASNSSKPTAKPATKSKTKQSKAKPKIAQPVAKSQTQLPKPKGPPKSKSKGKPKPKPKPESEPEPEPEPASEPDQPKKTIKLKLKSRLVAIDTEPEPEFEANLNLGESDSQEDNADEKVEQKTGGKGNDNDKLDMMELAFAVEHNGAHDIIQLAFAADFDVLCCKVSELLHVSPSDLQLAYKMPGMKNSDLRRHLWTHEHFEALKLEARKNIKGFVTEIEAANKKKGKVALGQQAKVESKLDSYVIEICDLAQTKSGGGSKQMEGSKATNSTKEDPNAKHAWLREYIKNRKCNKCGRSCGIINLPGRGPTHIPLSESCIKLWATLVTKDLASAYTPNPPSQVLTLLNDAQPQQQKKGSQADAANGNGSHLALVSAHPTNIPPNPTINTSFGVAAQQNNNLGPFLSPQVPLGFTPGMLFSLAAQMAQPQVMGPQVMGMGMGLGAGLPMFPGYGNLPFMSLGGFPMMQNLATSASGMVGAGVHFTDDSERFEGDSNHD